MVGALSTAGSLLLLSSGLLPGQSCLDVGSSGPSGLWTARWCALICRPVCAMEPTGWEELAVRLFLSSWGSKEGS